MKLIPVNYFGFTAIDKRFSSPMLPWIVAEIRKRTSIDKLSLGVENGHLQAYDKDFELQFAHRISNMTRFSQADFDPSIFLYLLRDDIEQLLYCYLFQTTKVSDVTDLYQQMKEQNVINPAKSISSSSAYNLTSLCGDISPSSSNFFEVLYIGKIKVWHKKVPDTFVDNALVKFRLHDLEKRDAKRLQRLKSEATIVRRGSLDSACDKSLANVPPLIRSASTLSSASLKTDGSEVDLRVPKAIDVDDIDRINEENEDETNGNSGNNDDNQRVEDAKAEPLQKSRSDTTINDSNNNDEHNRTMVLQVGRNDLRLISPDRKIVLLHKRHRDVSTCVQGMNNAEHFSFISREGNNVGTFIGYVFKCESKSVAAEAVSAITQAFANSDSRSLRPTLTSCEHCPMVWFHKLCVDVENLSDRKTQATILHRIETLDDEERNVIMTKYRGAETDSLREQNEFLMMLLRAHCEMKQAKHAHDTAENRSEFLNQYLGGGNTIFMKAKRSLSISFDHLLKRRGSKDDVNLAAISQMALPLAGNKDAASDRESDGFRSRSSTIGSQNDLKSYQHQMSERRAIEKNPKSPMMDIFLRIGNSPKTSSSDFDDCSPRQDAGSWRQAIFKRVVTPNKLQETDAPQEKRTTDELRQLWKKSIRQAILLIRMEKENAKLRARQEESAVKRIKLEYDEIRHHGRESLELWETLTAKNNCDENKSKLHDAIKRGVPRVRRGDVWQLLADDFNANFAATTDLSKYPNYHVSYENLLKQLTSHQHAILIDLGRTFPSHTYFSSPLGPGQLALFNLLKAYSLLDPEVGYCQGLSFVAGVLLLHMSESQAFSMLKHLMFCRGLRLQYLPDMIGLQIKFYQLSRLLHDQLPDLYEHLNFYDVTPTLYAAPWLLTLFASQFPLGFVTHVFDLLFMDDPNVVFKVALALLSYHRDVLLKCENFEEIMNYLKNTMTAINSQTLELTMKHVNSMDINKQLNVYLGEYQVLQEDVQSAQTKDDIINRLENEKRSLVMQNKHLEDQVQKLEKLRATQQGTIDKLEVHSRGMDVTLSTLALFVNDLMESDTSLEIPGEVQRILSEYSFHGRNGREEKPKDLTNRFKKPINPDKLMVKSLSTGLITLNNDAAMRTYSLNANYKEAHHNNNNFFSSSHLNILSEKTHNVGKSNGEENGLRGEAAKNKSMLMENSLPLRERADVATKSSPTLSIDSGIVTPSSPKDSHNSHPLSNCDIEFIYSGTRELKNIRQLKSSSKGAHADS